MKVRNDKLEQERLTIRLKDLHDYNYKVTGEPSNVEKLEEFWKSTRSSEDPGDSS